MFRSSNKLRFGLVGIALHAGMGCAESDSSPDNFGDAGASGGKAGASASQGGSATGGFRRPVVHVDRWFHLGWRFHVTRRIRVDRRHDVHGRVFDWRSGERGECPLTWSEMRPLRTGGHAREHHARSSRHCKVVLAWREGMHAGSNRHVRRPRLGDRPHRLRYALFGNGPTRLMEDNRLWFELGEDRHRHAPEGAGQWAQLDDRHRPSRFASDLHHTGIRRGRVLQVDRWRRELGQHVPPTSKTHFPTAASSRPSRSIPAIIDICWPPFTGPALIPRWGAASGNAWPNPWTRQPPGN